MYDICSMLTKKQKNLLIFINKKIRSSGVSPSYEEMKNLFNALTKHSECKHFENLDELYLDLKENIKNNDVVLFKASRAMHLEKIIRKFC